MAITVKCDEVFYNLRKEEDCRKLILQVRERCCTKPVTMADFDSAKRLIGMIVLSGTDSVQQICHSVLEELCRREVHMLFSGMLEVSSE